MREKVDEILRKYRDGVQEDYPGHPFYPDLVSGIRDSILTLICEEIEKVELPKYKKAWTSDGEKFIDCLVPVTPEDTKQTILALLRK